MNSNNIHELYGLQLAPLNKLRYLNMSNNDITKIEHLEKLKALKELDLSRNRIRLTER
jgi:Leucine-rich repeat (LRR) protein